MKKKKLVNKIFLENRSIIEQDMKKNHLPQKQAISHLTTILSNLYAPLHLEDKEENGKAFQVKGVYEYLPVKLGFYKLSGNLNPEEYIEQCQLILTEKGKEVYAEYKRLNIK